jgi:hypothetical protein
MADINTVLLTTASYNQIKAENLKYSLMLDNILSCAKLSEDHQTMTFDSNAVDAAIHFCFPECYKKKLATMKTQFARYGSYVQTKEGEDVNGMA